MIVYKITNKINNKCYIGQTVRKLSKRFSEHAALDRNYKISNAIHKYGRENFVLEILEEGAHIEDLNYLEVYYIKYYDSINNGYNLEKGGMNKHMSPENKIKMSLRHKGKKLTSEQVQKLKNSRQRPLICSNGLVYAGVREAARLLGAKHHTHIMRVLTKERNHWKGLTFQYVSKVGG